MFQWLLQSSVPLEFVFNYLFNFSDLFVEFYHVKDNSGGEAVRGVVRAHGDGGEVQLTELHPLDGAGGGIPVPGPEQVV